MSVCLVIQWADSLHWNLALYHKMESLTLMAPCIGFYPKDLFLIRLTSFFAYRTPRKWEKDPESTFFDDRDDDDDDYLGNEYRSWQWTTYTC